MSNYTPTTAEVASWMEQRGQHTLEEFTRWYYDQLSMATDVGYQGGLNMAARMIREYLPDSKQAGIVATLLEITSDDIVPGEN